MLVVYIKDDDRVIGWSYAEVTITTDAIIAADLNLQGVDFNKIGYGFYKDQEIIRKYDEDGPLPIYLPALGLQPMDAASLPKSMHVAALKSVAMVGGSPRGTVVRRYMGENYEVVNCRVSQIAYDNYQAGKIMLYDSNFGFNDPQNENSFVAVYFISENPYDTEISIPVIIDKVIK